MSSNQSSPSIIYYTNPELSSGWGSASSDEKVLETDEEQNEHEDRDPALSLNNHNTMDPFEIRVRFTQHLSGLNASVNSANKAAQFAIKHRDVAEDLHSCILEKLESSNNTMNNRANIMYLLEHICDAAEKDGHKDYIRMIQRDIIQIVDSVAPPGGAGAANVKVVRKVLSSLQAKSYLSSQTVSEIEEIIRDRDTILGSEGDITSPQQSLNNSTSRTKSSAPVPKLDRKQIEQRIEEDRERHKRAREEGWSTKNKGPDDEFDLLWDNTSDVGEDDFELYKEEQTERKDSAKLYKEDFRKKASGSE